jgi:Flp pilus assembly pilin Flp
VAGLRGRREDGASSVEYGLLAVAIAAVIVIIVFALGALTTEMFADTCSGLKAKVSTTQTC